MGAWRAIAGGYQLFAIAACLWHLRRGASLRPANPACLHPETGPRRAIPASTTPSAPTRLRNIPQFEILFGIRDPDDPAAPEIQRLIREFPAIPIRLIVCSTDAPNRKVGVLIDLAREARYPLLIVNDSDITRSGRLSPRCDRAARRPRHRSGHVPLSRGSGRLAEPLRSARHRDRFRAQHFGGALRRRIGIRTGLNAGVPTSGSGTHRRIRSHRRLPRRRLSTRPQAAFARSAQSRSRTWW